MPTSSIPATRSALVTGLQALTATGQALEGALVARTAILSEDPAYDRIVVGSAQDITREQRFYGERNESYVIPIDVEVIAQTGDISSVENHLWDVVTVVEQWLYANRNLAGLLIDSTVEDFEDEASEPAGSDPDTYVASTTLRLRCDAKTSLT
jgi:hypothetical protein